MNAELQYNHIFLINLLMVLNILRAHSFKFISPLSIPSEVLRVDDWHTIVLNQCKPSVKNTKKTMAFSHHIRLRCPAASAW